MLKNPGERDPHEAGKNAAAQWKGRWLVDRLYVNETINANAAVKAARDRTPKAGLKFQVTALVAELSGGPYKYHGKSMVESHKTLGITQKEWDAMAADFKKTLEKFKVPAPEQKELFDMVESTKKDIVVK